MEYYSWLDALIDDQPHIVNYDDFDTNIPLLEVDWNLQVPLREGDTSISSTTIESVDETEQFDDFRTEWFVQQSTTADSESWTLVENQWNAEEEEQRKVESLYDEWYGYDNVINESITQSVMMNKEDHVTNELIEKELSAKEEYEIAGSLPGVISSFDVLSETNFLSLPQWDFTKMREELKMIEENMNRFPPNISRRKANFSSKEDYELAEFAVKFLENGGTLPTCSKILKRKKKGVFSEEFARHYKSESGSIRSIGAIISRMRVVAKSSNVKRAIDSYLN